MICCSISQESRKAALAQMQHLARECDLVEVRLDRFGRAPGIADFVAAQPRPVLFSCRRRQDGGDWAGSEDERLALLRQCLVDRADYVELEWDVAEQVRPFPPTRRVVSYYNLETTPADLPDIYRAMLGMKPDVIKLVVRARTLAEAHPLLRVLVRGPAVPTVVVGLGELEVTLALLARKAGSPWTCTGQAPGQPTAGEWRDVYHGPAVGPDTRLVAVTGDGRLPYLTVALANTAFAHLGLDVRCLPVPVEQAAFANLLRTVALAGVLVDEEHRGKAFALAHEAEATARQVGAVDTLVLEGGKAQGYFLLCRAARTALKERMHGKTDVEHPLRGRVVAVVGTNVLAGAMLHRVVRSGGLPIVAGRDREAAQRLAKEHGCRYLPLEALYSTLHDVLIVCSEEKGGEGSGNWAEGGLSPKFLRPGMVVMDLTSLSAPSPFLREAQKRGAAVVCPGDILVEHVLRQVQLLTGQEVPRPVLLDRRKALTQDREELGQPDCPVGPPHSPLVRDVTTSSWRE